MRLLVAGDDRVGIVDWSSGATRIVQLPETYRFEDAPALGSQQVIRAFGLSWHGPAGVLVSCHERVGVLDHDLAHRGFLDISPLWYMTHAIAVRDGVLYTCNARIDVLGVHDLASGEERFLDVGTRRTVPNPQQLKPLSHGYEHDGHHPNAVVVSEEQIFVLTHPFDDSHMSTEVRVFDRATLQPAGEIGLDERPLGVPYAHDLAVVDGSVMWCDTFRRRVRTSDGASSPTLGDESFFLRGLAADETDVYVGCVSRRGSAETSASIVRLDRSTLAEIERLAVPFPVEICAIRLVDSEDLAHPGAGPAPIRNAC